MKHLKILGLLALAATVLLAIAGTASATKLTSPASTTYTGAVTAESANFELEGSFPAISCESNLGFEVEQHGVGKNAGGTVSSWTFGGCTGGTVASPVAVGGSISIDSSTNVYSTGAQIVAYTSVGECVFTTSATKIATFTPSPESATSAVIALGSSTVPRTGGAGGFLCGSSATLTGSYSVTSPIPLYLD